MKAPVRRQLLRLYELGAVSRATAASCYADGVSEGLVKSLIAEGLATEGKSITILRGQHGLAKGRSLKVYWLTEAGAQKAHDA